MKTKTLKAFKDTKFFKPHLVAFALAFAVVGGLIIYRSFAVNPNLPGDVNNDNKVDVTDLSLLLSNYNTNYPPADFNADGTVNVLDMSTLLTNYGRSYSGNIWNRCASENQQCIFSGTKEVRYGTNNTYAYGTYTNGVSCSNSVFGDPYPGAEKFCDYRDTASTPPPPTGSLHLSWDTYEQVPAKYGALDRMETTTLSSMPPGVSKVIRVNVNNTDNTSATGDGTYALNRSDGQGEAWVQEGTETWESFWYLIPDGTDSRYPGTWRHSVVSSGWNTFYEYHEPGIAQRSTHLGAWGSDPPVWQLALAGGNPSSPSDVWVRGPVIEPNKWHFMLFHWKWSRQNSGFVEAWINGQQWISQTTPNLLYGNSNFPGAQNYPVANNFPTAWNVNGTTKGGYFEIGHYRGPSRSDAETTYMAKIRIGTTRSVVEGN